MGAEVQGLSKLDRQRLTQIYRATKGTVSVSDVAETLDISSSSAGKLLFRWAAKGWLFRVSRGLYIPVPLESTTADVPLEDAWVVASRLFEPCYMGGWSAAEYWDLTEQIYRTVNVMTTQRPRNRQPTVGGTEFRVRTIGEDLMFGLAVVWRGQVKVRVSDPSRTIVDMLAEPAMGGGIRSCVDMLKNFLQSDKQDLQLLIEYGDRYGNGAVFKRLGFLLEQLMPEEETILQECKARLTKGNTTLDPKLPATKLVTRWRLWTPPNWRLE
jgi:predicted transcriptional regulator of viral defense system